MAAVLDKPQINLANVKTSITSIVEAQLDKINTMESSREIFLFIRNLFDKHNIDTKKSRDIIQNLATMRNVENARAYIYNFCLKGEGQGTLEIDKKPRYKNKMFKIDEKLKKIVSEDIEKIEVETTAEEITVETDGDAVKVEVEPKAAECADCRIPVESTADLDDYAFFSDLNPETDIDDIPADAEPDGTENVEESLFKESAQGTYSMRMYDYIDEYLDNEGRKDLCYAFTKWLSDDEVHEFAKANDLVPVFEDEDDLYESIEKKYVKPLKDKINACYTKQDLDEIGAYLDDFSDKDIDRILSGKVSNKDVNKMFGGYNFVDDDFPGWDFKESKSIKESYSYSRIYEYIDSILGDCCRGERRWPKADPNDFARILEDEYNLESEEDYSWKDLCRVIHDIYPNGEYAGDELDESKSIKEEYIEATPNDKDCFAFITTINKRTRETKRQRIEGSYGKIRGIIASKQRNETLYDFEGPFKNESKSIKESADSRVNTVEYGPYDKWYEFERLYLPGKNGKHDVRIYFYEGDDAAEDYEDYDVSVDIADESILVDELKLAREIGYTGFHPYLTAFNWDGAVECCEDIYDYFMEIPQEEIYDTLVNKLGCDEGQVSRFFQPSMNESKCIKESANVETNTTYLARAMHKMYVDGYNYQEIADVLGAPVSLVIKMIGPDSYDESLTESTEKQYIAIDTQDKDNKDNTRKYTEKQLIDFAKELIKIEEESSEPDQYKKRPELKDDLASAKKVLKYFMYDVKEAE